MFYLNKNVELNEALLHKMINRFILNVLPKLNRNKNYYDGVQAILQKTYIDPTKPCNRTITNFTKNITDSYAGYIASPGCISYSSSEDIADIMNVLRNNDFQSEDASFLLDALIYGVAAELMYADAAGQARFRTIDPKQCFGVFDDSLDNNLLYFVRFYPIDDWDESDNYQVDVYDSVRIRRYKMIGLNGYLSFIEEMPHFYSDVPANIFYLPDEKSIFDCVLELQDSYNEILSAEIDDYQAFCDAYLVLEAADADEDDIAAMKRNRVMILPEGAKSYYVTKPSNDTQIENMLGRIQTSIYRTAQCPDFSSESFVGGVSSGIAIQYRLTGMETRAGIIEGFMTKALQRRIELLCGLASLKMGEDVYKEIKITFIRNIPEDETAIINKINSLKGTVSDETLIAQLDFIDDPAAELEKVNAQKQANMQVYSFNSSFGDDEE